MKISELSLGQLESNNVNRFSRVGEGATTDPKKIKELSRDFEAIFMQIVLKSMRDSVQKSGFVDGGNSEDIFRSMLDGEYAKQMAKQQTSGLASSIEDHFLRASGTVKALQQKSAINRYQSD